MIGLRAFDNSSMKSPAFISNVSGFIWIVRLPGSPGGVSWNVLTQLLFGCEVMSQRSSGRRRGGSYLFKNRLHASPSSVSSATPSLCAFLTTLQCAVSSLITKGNEFSKPLHKDKNRVSFNFIENSLPHDSIRMNVLIKVYPTPQFIKKTDENCAV